MKKAYIYLGACAILILSFASCDEREILLPIELPYEEPKMFLGAFVENGQIPKIDLTSTRPIDGEYQVSSFIAHADMRLHSTQGLETVFFPVIDTMYSYDITFGPNGFDTLATYIYVESYYTTDDVLTFELGEHYWIEVEAEGFPRLVSDPVVFKDEINAVDFQYSPPYYWQNSDSVLVFDEITFTLQKRGLPAICRVGVAFHFWNPVTGPVFSGGIANGSYGIDLPAVERIEVPLGNNQPVVLYGQEVYSEDFHAEGVAIVLTTYDENAVTFRDATLENGRYIGGFFPPNPTFPHTVAGGYGIFTIVEKDIYILQ